MELDEIFNIIPEDIRETAKEKITGMIEAEKQRGIDSYRKKDAEVLKYKNTLKDLGYDSEKYSSVEEFKESMKQTVTSANDQSLAYKVMQEKVETLAKAYEEEKNNRSQAEKKAKTELIRNKLTESISDKLYASSAIIENILLKDELEILDNEIVSKDGKSFDNFLKELLEKHKGAIKVSQTPGVDLRVKQTKQITGERNKLEEAKAKMPVFQKQKQKIINKEN